MRQGFAQREQPVQSVRSGAPPVQVGDWEDSIVRPFPYLFAAPQPPGKKGGKDKAKGKAPSGWLLDYESARASARQTKQPLLVVFH